MSVSQSALTPEKHAHMFGSFKFGYGASVHCGNCGETFLHPDTLGEAVLWARRHECSLLAVWRDHRDCRQEWTP